MSRYFALVFCVFTFLVTGESAEAQTREDIVGTWTLISFKNISADNSSRDLFGTDPKGIMIFQPSGRYVQLFVRSNREKFKANNRIDATPEEAKAAMDGAFASIGTWSFDEASKTVIRNVEASATFPNEEGRQGKWVVAISGDTMTVTVPAAGAGGKNELVLKRSNP